MSTLDYVQPPEFETGQILGRANLGILVDNDDYFRALADRWRPIPYGVSRGWIGDETYQVVFDGFHFLESDALTLAYHLTLAGRDSTGHAHLYYNWDGNVGSPGGTLIATISSNGSVSSTYDLSTFFGTNGAGLYRVGCVQHRNADGSDENLVTTCRPPYTTYTGAKSFSTPPTIADEATGTAAHLNTWRSNDLFFHDCTPRQPAFVGMARSHVGSGTTTVIWDGWIRHRSSRMYYYIDLDCDDEDSNASNNRIVIKYDYDGTPETVKTHSTHGSIESYADLAGSYTVGNWYRCHIELKRDNTTWNATGSIYYLYMAPPQDAAGGETAFSLMDEFSPDQWVYGDTAGQDTRLELLSDNDTYIYEVLCWDSDSVGRLDFTVSKPAFIRLGGTDTGDYRLVRRGDTLYYRGADLSVRWGDDNSEALADETDTYATLDLNSIDLPHGTIYTITGDSLQYAMEA